MKKLALDLDRISIESFDTSATRPGAIGTVRGQEYDTGSASCGGTCFGKTKCGISICVDEPVEYRV
jgi:hypothetical protein